MTVEPVPCFSPWAELTGAVRAVEPLGDPGKTMQCDTHRLKFVVREMRGEYVAVLLPSIATNHRFRRRDAPFKNGVQGCDGDDQIATDQARGDLRAATIAGTL